jgi:hypothetical protein
MKASSTTHMLVPEYVEAEAFVLIGGLVVDRAYHTKLKTQYSFAKPVGAAGTWALHRRNMTGCHPIFCFG